MLNYVWIGLIVVAVLAAVGNDVSDEIRNPYRNEVPLGATLEVHGTPAAGMASWSGELILSADAFNSFYGIAVEKKDIRQEVKVVTAADGSSTMQIPIGDQSPQRWKDMANLFGTRDRLTATLRSIRFEKNGTTASVSLVFEPIHFVKMKAVTQAALDYAATAVTIALGLIGIMALWLGVMKVAEEAGVVRGLTRLLAPITKRLFPEIPPDHPAVGAMIMNISANMLGLNNAATPFGLKAMEELNKLNPTLGTATNAMCTFLVINTGGLVLIPATAMAVRAAAGSSNPGIIIGTSIVGAGCATVFGVIAAKLMQRMPRYRNNDPALAAASREGGPKNG